MWSDDINSELLDESLITDDLKQIAEALYVRGIPVNGLVYTNTGAVFSVSLSICDFEKNKCVFSTSANIYSESVSGSSYIINKICFEFFTLTSRSIDGNNIYKMYEAVINAGNGLA